MSFAKNASACIALRCNAFITVIQAAKGTLFSSPYGTRPPENVFAHTSPVYAAVNGKPIRSWDDPQYYVD